MLATEHAWCCNRNPENKGLELGITAHRDGTIRGWLKWYLSFARCDVKVTRLQEALDRLQISDEEC